MYNRVFKKFIALLLFVVLLSQSSISVIASSRRASELGELFAEIGICPIASSIWISSIDIDWASGPENWVPYVLAIQESTFAAFEESLVIARSDIVESEARNFTPVCTEIIESQIIYGMPIDVFNAMTLSKQAEIRNLEVLAASIFDFYTAYGFFPTQDEFVSYHSLGVSASSSRSDFPIIPMSTCELTQAVSIFQQMGIWVSNFAVSLAAARIGTIAAIGAAIPIIQVVALVVGTTIVVGGIMLGLAAAYANMMAISWELHWMMAHTSAWDRAVAENTIRQTRAIQNARLSGFQHFAAQRHWGPGGGVLILWPITRELAITAMSGGADTFSTSRPLAHSLAMVLSTQVRLDWGHRLYKYPLNLPHYHPIAFWLPPHLNPFGHAFFPFF